MNSMAKEFFFYTEEMTVGYDGKPLIRDIRIELDRGEILTLIGPNGAGKSTILKSVTRQLKLIGGCVYLDGRQMQQMTGREIARRQAVVLTERIRPELMTCEDVVATGRYPYTGSLGILGREDRVKVRAALQTVHAADLAERDFNAVSDGQRQRILLARAICQEPELIVLDEPTSFLDVKHKLEFLQILKQMVRERHVAVIMSLHELDLAQKISDRLFCVKGGHIDRHGTPEEIFTSDYICGLYDLPVGAWNAAFGCVELPAVRRRPEVFVIAGNGSGIPVYRRLQREGIPFVTGVLQENDVDYPAARDLAAEVVAERAFEPIGEEAYALALSKMRQCRRVLCPLQTFGAMNRRNEELLREAGRAGILVKVSPGRKYMHEQAGGG